MNLFFKLLLPASCLCCITLTGVWVMENDQASRLAEQLSESQQNQRSVEARSAGLQQANETLRQQIEELRNVTFLVEFTVEESFPEDTEPSGIPGDLPPAPPGMLVVTGENASPSGPSLAEQIKAQEKERKRKEWRKKSGINNARYNERLRDQYATRREFFAQVDQEGLSPDYLKANQQVLSALDEIDDMMVSLVDPELDYNERRELNSKVFLTARDVITPVMSKQREILLNDYAQFTLGLSGKETQQLLDYIDVVKELSTLRATF